MFIEKKLLLTKLEGYIYLVLKIVCTTVEVERFIGHYHVYKEDRNPNARRWFDMELNKFNDHDRYTVAVQVDGETVGNLPIEVSKICYCFVKNCGCITGEITGKEQK